MADPQVPAASASPDRDPIYAADEVRPPTQEANSFGGPLDAADLPPPVADEPGRGSAHDDEGWRAIGPAKP